MPIVAMPDGTQVSFPDNLPPEQIKGLIASKFPDAVPKQGPPPPPSLGQKIRQDLSGAGAQSSADQSNYGPVLGGINAAGDVAGGIGRAGLDAFKSIFPGAAQDISSVIKPAVGAVSNISAPSIGLHNTVGQDLSALSQAYPKTAHTLGNVANIAGIAGPGGKLMEGAIDAAPSVARFTGDVVGDLRNPPPPPAPSIPVGPTASDIRTAASQNYKTATAQSLPIDANSVSELGKNLSALEPTTDLEKRAWSSSKAADHVQDINNSLAIENPSFNGLLAKRTQLNSDIKVAARAGNDAEVQKLNRVKDALDATMIGSDPGTWRMANHQWAQQATLEDVDELVNRAATRAQPANSLDTSINNYLNSYKSNGLSDAERSALKSVTNNSSFDKLRKGAASGLLKFFSGTASSHLGPAGFIPGYLAGHYGSEFLKDSAMAAKLSKLDEFRGLIASRELPAPKPTQAPLQLTYQPSAIAVDSAGNAVPMSGNLQATQANLQALADVRGGSSTSAAQAIRDQFAQTRGGSDLGQALAPFANTPLSSMTLEELQALFNSAKRK